MAVELEEWGDPEAILKAKLDADRAYRRDEIEREWNVSEDALRDAGYDGMGSNNGQVHPEQASTGTDADDINPNISYVFQHYRLLHSQMSANPPVVGTKPLSMDEMDQDAADAAGDAMRYWHRHKDLQSNVDRVTAKTLKYGTGWLKVIYDPDLGEMVDFNESTDMVTMEGDASVYSPSTWDVWIDSTAMRPDDVEHQWERMRNCYEYWAGRFHKDWQRALLKAALESSQERQRAEGEVNPSSDIELFYYYEKGMPRNAMRGRFAICTEDGKLLTDGMQPNPHFYRKAKSRKERLEYLQNPGEEYPQSHPVGKLPMEMLTDIEVDDRVYGRSFIFYEANGQDIINRLDAVMLNNIKAFGSINMVASGGANLEAESINDDQFTVLKTEHPGQVHFMSRPGAMPDAGNLRQALKQGGDDTAGVNDAMTGKIERETSGSAIQIAASQGNSVRRPLFNKYTKFCENVYRSLMMVAKEHWSEGKTIDVLGEQGSFKQKYIKAADIDGGFEYFSTYGESFSLDPNMRRQEIMQLIPILQESGIITARQIVDLMKLNDLELAHDMISVGKDRQKAIFAEIKETKKQVPVDAEFEDHDSMLEYARFYMMTAEFQTLGKSVQKLIKEHTGMRMEAVAAQAPQAPPGPEQAQAGPPPPQLPQ